MVLKRMDAAMLTLSASELREFGREFATTCISRRTPTQIRSEREELLTLMRQLVVERRALSDSQSDRLKDLLSKPDVSTAVSLQLGLETIRASHADDDNFVLGTVAGMMIARWKTDRRMVAFYRGLLRTNASAAIGDLAYRGESPFDKSFIEPLLTFIGGVAPDMHNSIHVGRALNYMDRNFAAWSGDTSVSRRLGQAVRRFEPADVTNGMYVWLEWAAQTHDRGMIALLRPLLDDKTIEPYTSNSSNMPAFTTPMRYSELAANAICRILDEPILFDPWRRARVDRAATAPYPEWAEWDNKIATLKQRLDRM
jgi:hypothetical protein